MSNYNVRCPSPESSDTDREKADSTKLWINEKRYVCGTAQNNAIRLGGQAAQRKVRRYFSELRSQSFISWLQVRQNIM